MPTPLKRVLGHKHSSDAKQRSVRTAVRSVECPYCGAKPREKCIGVQGQLRSASHEERWDAYRKQTKLRK